jgi:hypothetical protein
MVEHPIFHNHNKYNLQKRHPMVAHQKLRNPTNNQSLSSYCNIDKSDKLYSKSILQPKHHQYYLINAPKSIRLLYLHQNFANTKLFF